MKHHTSDHDGSSCLTPRAVISGSCEPAAGPLKDERDEITCHESDCVGTGAETRDLLAVEDDDATETEVKGAGEESGGNR